MSRQRPLWRTESSSDDNDEIPMRTKKSVPTSISIPTTKTSQLQTKTTNQQTPNLTITVDDEQQQR